MNLWNNPSVLGRFLAGAVLASFLAGCGRASRQSTSAPEGVFFSNATINGQAVLMRLDTGSSTTILWDSAAYNLGVDFKPLPGVYVNSSRGVLGLAEPTPVRLGSWTGTIQLPVYIWESDPNHASLPKGFNPKTDACGLLGWSEVKDDILVFDSTQHTIISAEKLPPETATWLKLKVHPNGRLMLDIPLADGSTGTFFVDTGSAGGVMLPTAQWQEWKASHPAVPLQTVSYSFIGSEVTEKEGTLADEVKLGPLTLTHVPVQDAGSNADRMVGLAALGRMDLVVDGPHGFAYLKPKPPLAGKNSSVPSASTFSAQDEHWLLADDIKLNTGRLVTNASNFSDREYSSLEKSGQAKQFQGDSAGALSDWEQAIELKPDDSAYPRLFRQLLQLRLGQPTPDFAKTVASWKDGWTKSVGQFLAGGLDESALLAAAEKSDVEPMEGQKCEAYYYIGMMRLLKGDTAGAREFFQKSVATDLKTYYEYQFAQAELAHLDNTTSK